MRNSKYLLKHLAAILNLGGKSSKTRHKNVNSKMGVSARSLAEWTFILSVCADAILRTCKYNLTGIQISGFPGHTLASENRTVSKPAGYRSDVNSGKQHDPFDRQTLS